MADADRLQAIQDDFNRGLEARITHVMSQVQAAREINRQLQEADNHIAMHQADIEVTEQEIAALGDDSDDFEAGLARVDALRQAIQETQALRGELLDALHQLAGNLDG